ncbi:MAG: tetratricopeptide repeat protein [Firmicutes bacterium]|nr:tetratricopeptide repeat protein [Bacillota bacterium]
MAKKSISPKTAAKLMEAMLKAGALSCMYIDGTSMEPYIRNGSKVIVDHRVKDFSGGDVILFEREVQTGNNEENSPHNETSQTETEKFSYIHRIVDIKGDFYITKGDNRFSFDPPIKKENIKGLVTSVENDGHKIFLNEEPWLTIGRNTALLSVKTGLLHSELFEENCPGDAEELHNKAFKLYLDGQKEESLAFFRKALALDPKRALSRVDAGEILRQMGKYSEALVHLRLAIEIDMRRTEVSAQAYNIIGNTLFDLGKIEESLEEYTSSISIEPNFVPPYINRAWALLKLDRVVNAEKDLEKALQLEPENFKALKYLGLLYLKTERTDNAFESFMKATGIKPEDADVLNYLGIIHLKNTDYDKSREMFEKAIYAKPDHFDAVYNLGLLFEATDRLEEAKKVFKALMDSFPDYEGLKEKALYLTCKINKK